MATYTAQALVGQAHPNHGGITPTQRLYLSENSRPAWILLSEGIPGQGSDRTSEKIIWTPTLDRMMEDALLMIALYVLEDPTARQIAGASLNGESKRALDVGAVFDEQTRQKLYARCRAMENRYKLVLTVLEGSSIARQLGVLDAYSMDVEVCTPRYSRSYSRWRDEVIVRGTLDANSGEPR
jgi:hypothetical protein